VIDAHFDEIGLMVTEICDGGFLKMASIGGVSVSILQGADVVVYGKQNIRGIITSTPPHLRADKNETLASIDELFVDTGYSKEEIDELVSVGTPIGFPPCYREMLGGVLVGKSFDNKACAAVALTAVSQTPREALAADVAVLLSAFEETSRIGGAGPATFGLDPDYAMVIDVNLARVPDVPKAETVPLGKGVSLSASAATDRALTKATRRLCQEKELAHCIVAAPCSTGTNAATVNLVRGGVPVVDVGLPLRSMHTYNEVISLADAETLCRLVQAFVCSEEIAERFDRKGREELPL
jgi:endoglucanase